MKNFEEKEFLPSFARQRIRGASSDRKKFLQDEFIPKRIAKPETKGEVVFEIGSGNGETAVNYASLNPHISYIACEVFLDGVLQMAGKALDKNLQNISFFMEDARDLLSKMPDESIKAVFLFFPDPWPKKRHHKRRILNLQFLEIVHKKLAKDGNLMVATDHPSYKLHIN
jgi:tRNA (guanine-N7-)-methyltransferase